MYHELYVNIEKKEFSSTQHTKFFYFQIRIPTNCIDYLLKT